MSFEVGDNLGDYQVTGILGAGGMGAVYRVKHLISDRTEALKVLLPDMQGNPELAERFLREIRLQAALSHPAIAALHNAFRVNNQLLMVMEYIDGESLDSFLRRERMDLWTSVDLTIQILAALSYAHGRGVIHRDIKPANIMLTAGGRVKLMDFGIARLTKDQRITQTGMAIGSLYYMSPEQVRGSEVDPRSDLYSAGVMLYEMATGERPIRGENSYAVMEAHLHRIPRAPDMLNSQISSTLAHAILLALEKDPNHRYHSADEFAATLDDIRRRAAFRSMHSVFDAGESRPTPLSSAQPAAALPVASYVGRAGGSPVAAEVTPPEPPARPDTPKFFFDPERLEKVRRDLATYIGPVARVLVERTARKATSWKELYEVLAKEVPAGSERDRFLASKPVNF